MNDFRMALDIVRRMVDLAELAASCCDAPEDRMYHAADHTWWRREGLRWVVAEPPHGWKENGASMTAP